jgi:hypothetical protein
MKDIIADLECLMGCLELDGNRIQLQSIINKLKEQEKWLLPDWRELKKPIMCLDFDGVVSEYKHGWEGPGTINDIPVPGAIEFIQKALKHFHVLIFSSRCNHPEGIAAMKEWLLTNGLQSVSELHFQPGKPSFSIMIDDRALKFNGDWNMHEPIQLARYFKPWYYHRAGWRRQ